MLQAANYTAERTTVDGVEVIHLADAAAKTEVWIAPSFGNNAYSMKVNGKDVFWRPTEGLGEWMAKPAQGGNPFLHPWCNRIDGDAYWANGKKYLLNADLKNFRKDGNGKPIHGLVAFADEWRVSALEADDDGAVTSSRLEFRRPDWLAQFPWAHNVVMTHRLRGGVLEVETKLENLSTEPMPVSLGYHAYYRVHDAPRDQWRVHIGAKDHVTLSGVLIPTGETTPVTFADPMSLDGTQFDDVFSNLVRDADGRARFSVTGNREKVTVEFGPAYPVGVVYAPQGRGFICFEPMAGVTNVFNLAHEGKFPLQSVPAGGEWKESFWIRPAGF
ncbi:MAG: aldose 1-epimerase [Bryobacteraceae bacterium]